MKNKEIEEILQTLNGIASGDWIQMLPKEANLLLSYIEQLEKENKILRENAENNDKVVDKVNWENQQLKKQKDDVVEYIKSNCIVSDEWTELDFCNFVPTGKVNYKALNKEKIKDLLRMLGEIDVKD